MVWALYARASSRIRCADRSHAAELRWYTLLLHECILFVFTRGNRIVKRRFYFFRRRAAWKLTSSRVIPMSYGRIALPVRAEYRYESRYDLPSECVHGVFTDNPTQGTVGSLTQASSGLVTLYRYFSGLVTRYCSSSQRALRSRPTSASHQKRPFTHGFHVHRFDFVDKRRFPVRPGSTRWLNLPKRVTTPRSVL